MGGCVSYSNMAKTFRAYVPEQNLLLPASLREWLPDDHLAYFVSDVVDQLDLSGIECVYEKEDRGQPPYHPRMMTKILVYGYCVGSFRRGGSRSDWWRTSLFEYGQRGISRTSAPSRIFGSFI